MASQYVNCHGFKWLHQNDYTLTVELCWGVNTTDYITSPHLTRHRFAWLNQLDDTLAGQSRTMLGINKTQDKMASPHLICHGFTRLYQQDYTLTRHSWVGHQKVFHVWYLSPDYGIWRQAKDICCHWPWLSAPSCRYTASVFNIYIIYTQIIDLKINQYISTKIILHCHKYIGSI